MNRKELIQGIEENLSTRRLSDKFRVSQSTIKYWLKKYGLKTNFNIYGYKENKTHRCSKCGESNPAKFYGKRLYTCGKCYNQIVIECSRRKRRYILDNLGNACDNCGFTEFKSALDVHHVDRSKKDKNFKSKLGWSYKRIDREIENCIILCKNCHSAFHTGELEL